ncbi:hypothetical protein D6C98_01861 [Aureobasidium pullulans]|uniref:Uncharacterized protein n=1 Tax=Aureobasidium pullulans TaxID=5580 RepID=A0A4S9NVV2_AURPU|nr:hypothetical protein D6D28_05881 [Aureobasidium pullulans]THW28853.1 hypothetical protein D6D23_01588 [Aureobasidium pullulans]THY08837.1 hypothetical protein D6D03_00852 [Aureobasidium pullulans]THY61711.1 hypothetical protein D6C98_01861 [Aureobasidium pullulans]THZ25848.1 hypothetical protein D6C89_04109 [Aureobasidium pullulans]
MADLDYGSDPITIEVLFQTPEEELLTSVFVKREGHDPKEEEMLEQHIMKDHGTSTSNPFDLSRRPRLFATNPESKRQKKDVKEAQRVTTRSSTRASRLTDLVDAPKKSRKQRQDVKETPSETSEETSSRPNMRAQPEPTFADMMTGFDTKLPVQAKSSPPPSNNDQPAPLMSFDRANVDEALAAGKREPFNDMPASTQPLSAHPSAPDEQLTTESNHVAASPASSQQPAPTLASEGIDDTADLPEHPPTSAYPAQISEQIDGFISEALGPGIGDQVRNIFKSAMFNMSLWILQHTPTLATPSLTLPLTSLINLNEKNSRAANKSLEAALDSYNLTDVNLTPKAIEHYQLLDKQEKERQEFLEGMVEMLRAPESAEEKIVKEVMGMRDEMLEKRDVWDDEERDVVMEDEVDETLE